MINIVLYRPQIPQNAGNIIRTCAVTGSKLHMIRPLGFNTDEKSFRRAGLDYFSDADLEIYDDFEDFIEKNNPNRIYLVTTKAEISHTDATYDKDEYFMFGSETKGLPEYIHEKYSDFRVRIPMLKSENARCLNLSNSVSIITYEALRQNKFLNLE